jgi:ketosteroid isomerase-like protein
MTADSVAEHLAPLDLPHPADDDRTARAASLRSRAFTQAKDREGWLSLFAPDAVVADPVGPSVFDEVGEGHKGIEAIGAFWDNVIAPQDVRMDIRLSNSGGDKEVANLLTITTTFPDGSGMNTDMVACYRVDDDGKIVSLRAYWEFDKLRFTPAPDAG